MLSLVDLAAHDNNTLLHVANICAAMDPWLRLGIDADNLLAFYKTKSPERTCSLIYVDHNIAGILCLQYPWLRGVYIEQLALFPEFQHSGFGTQVVHMIEEKYQSKTKNLWLLVSAFNAQAIKFYKSQGFTVIGLIPELLKQGEDEIIMRKILHHVC